MLSGASIRRHLTAAAAALRLTPALKWLAAAVAAFAVLFLTFPEIDLWAARLFADRQGDFWLESHPVLRALNDFVPVLAVFLIVLGIGGTIYTKIRDHRLFGLAARHYFFVFMSVAIGPGLIANAIFKEHWGRARPRTLVEFGGNLEFTPALMVADQCERNCSFVAGDPSLVFACLAVALLAPRRRPLWIALALIAGAIVGVGRMAQGAHFLSDVIFAGLFVAIAVLLLKQLIVDAGDASARSPEAFRPSGFD